MKTRNWKRFKRIGYTLSIMGMITGTNFPTAVVAETIPAAEKVTESGVDNTHSSTEKKRPSSKEAERTAIQNETVKTASLQILGTSDVHGQLWNWSYEDNQSAKVGLAHVSSTVQALREKNPNGTVLIDNGDMLQGTILTDDLYNVDPILSKQEHPMIKAMNAMHYDAMTLGNHEFNFGLPLIEKVQKEASFPLLSANTYKKDTNEHFVGSTTIKELDVDKDGTTDVKVGILGLTTPHIPKWDGDKVSSLSFEALKSGAEKGVQELKEKQADIIVASIHAGREDADPDAAANTVIQTVKGIDAYLLGHDHSSFADVVEGPDGKQIPIAGPKDTGIQLMQINLDVQQKGTEWEVTQGTPSIIDTTTYDADESLKDLTKEAHQTTVNFISAEIGQATGDFLPKQTIKGIPEAQLQPTAMISLINNVQRKVTGADLSASALFKADSKFPAGPLNYANVFDIYKYPNTLVKAKITGEQLLAYMENQASYYNTPKPEDLTVSFNPAVRVYNYDMFSGVDYTIDISKPVGQRITATINKQPIDRTKEYTIAINNYRYEGLVTGGYLSENSLIENTDPKTLRGLIVDYIKEKQTLDPEKEIENNWQLIGTNFDQKWRNLAIGLVNSGKLTIKDSEDGRTPNVVPITKKDVQKALGMISILHTNDIHGRLEENSGNSTLGMAKLKGFKDSYDPTIMIDAGDAFQGLPISNFSKGEDMAKIMNQVGYDAMVVGNHEFDFGLDVALSYKSLLVFPLLSANTYKENKLLFEPYTIIEKESKKIAVIGVTTPETATKTHPNNVVGVTFKDPLPEAQSVIDQLKADPTIDLFVIAGHLGVDETTPKKWRGDYVAEELNKANPNLSMVFIDGHSHTEFENGQKFGDLLYAQTGNYLNNVGEIVIDEQDAQQSFAKLNHYANLATTPPDATVASLVQEAATKFAAWGSEVVVPNNTIFFNGQREFVRTRETNLGNIIGDAMWSYGQEGFQHPTDFAVTNGGGIRENIHEQAITKGDIIAVLPFGNSISQIAVTGKQIKEMFEYSLRSDVQKNEAGEIIKDEKGQPMLGSNGGFLHVSKTVKLHFDSAKTGTTEEKVGERILQIEIFDRTANSFKPIVADKIYYMATNDFLAAGGDGYTMLGGEREEGPSLDDVFTSYLQSATQLRLLDEATNIDLNQYKEELPYARIIPMSQAEFEANNKPKPEPTPEPDPGQDGEDGKGGENGAPGQNGSNGTDGSNGQNGTDGSNGTNGTNEPTKKPSQPSKPAAGNGTTGQGSTGSATSANQGKFPLTGEEITSYALLGTGILSLAGIGYWYKRKKSA